MNEAGKSLVSGVMRMDEEWNDPVLARIDDYELVRELGGGGFGTVYLARDTVSGVAYAVKGLPPSVKGNREELENIKANFALVSRLSHTNIARAHVPRDAEWEYAANQADAWGLRGMWESVAEWCDDMYPRELLNFLQKDGYVLRGGANCKPQKSDRQRRPTNKPHETFGLRLCFSIQPP